jgi:hypothetical protein
VKRINIFSRRQVRSRVCENTCSCDWTCQATIVRTEGRELTAWVDRIDVNSITGIIECNTSREVGDGAF